MAFADSFKLKYYVQQFNFGNVQGIQDKLSRIACQAMFLWEAFRLASFLLTSLFSSWQLTWWAESLNNLEY